MFLLNILLYNIIVVRIDWIKFFDVCLILGENLYNKLKCLLISKKIILDILYIIGFLLMVLECVICVYG